MPVRISVKDGPTAAEWLSPAIVPGTGDFTAAQSFTPSPNAVDYVLAANTNYNFKITVDNLGTEDAAPFETEPLLGPGPWPFVPPAVPVKGQIVTSPNPNIVSTLSPSGTSRTEVETISATEQRVRLVSLPGGMPPRVLATFTVKPNTNTPPDEFDFGHSSDGHYWVLWFKNPIAGQTDKYLGRIFAADDVDPVLQRAGTLILNIGIQVSDPNVVFFMPGNRDALLTWDATNPNTPTSKQTARQSLNLRPRATGARLSSIIVQSQTTANRFLAGPAGDFLAVIGDPPWAVFVHALPDINVLGLVPRSKGIQTSLPAGPNVTLTQVKRGGGFDAILVDGLSDPNRVSQTIDTPVKSFAAVEVYLWVDLSSSVFNYSSAKQFPGLRSNQTPPVPSAFIDRIARNSAVDVVVLAGWSATLPPANQHYCAIAEAFTAEGIVPPCIRIRTSDAFDILGNEQIGLRNLTVV